MEILQLPFRLGLYEGPRMVPDDSLGAHYKDSQGSATPSTGAALGTSSWWEGMTSSWLLTLPRHIWRAVS